MLQKRKKEKKGKYTCALTVFQVMEISNWVVSAVKITMNHIFIYLTSLK